MPDYHNNGSYPRPGSSFSMEGECHRPLRCISEPYIRYGMYWVDVIEEDTGRHSVRNVKSDGSSGRKNSRGYLVD